MTKQVPNVVLAVILSVILTSGACPAHGQAADDGGVHAPVLKWQKGACYSSWCETGWYSSPAVADLDDDGHPEVIGATYSVFALDGKTGTEKWKFDPPGGRAWPGVVVVDLEDDGDLEIVTAHGDGYLYVFDHEGNVEWFKQPTPGNELRSLASQDLDGDGDLEIMVASTRSDNQWYVYEHTGNLRQGNWPQHHPNSDDNGYSAGCFNQNLAAGDLDGDGLAEIVGPSDVHYVTAYQDDGTQIRANAIYGNNPDGSRKYWSRVGVHVDHKVDLRGYAHCGSEHRPNFAHSAPVVVDVNSDGVLEVVVVGNVYNCGTSPYTDLYEMPYILNGDRTRWKADGFDWTVIPTADASAAPLSEDYNLIENAHPNPVAADLDGDGFLEILFSSYDGRVHAFWLDREEHGSWPFSVNQAGEGFCRFASEPAVADLDADGLAEIILVSWTQKGSNRTGKLHILDYQGNALHELSLPPAFGSWNWNGGLAAPTLADIDGDPDLEVVLNTAHSGVVAYDLPGTGSAEILWGTGRGSYYRSGSQTGLPFKKKVSRGSAEMGQTLNYTMTLVGSGRLMTVTDTIPEGTILVPGSPFVNPPIGSFLVDSGGMTWAGELTQGETLEMGFAVTITVPGPQAIRNQARADDGQRVVDRSAHTIVGGVEVYLPLLRRSR